VAEQLGPLSAELRPALADLRPTLSALRPALTSLSGVLDVSPPTLGAANGFLPGADQSLRAFLPMLDFLRPYTPEMAGALANWASAASNFDRNGHYLRVQSSTSTAGFDGQPALFSPAQRVEPRRAPGENEGQSWPDANAGATDANGTRMR
ncbi:MAG TPA: MCE family protein, partial [Acidimicrobiia bacterium]|nr:MCE family protein [Acidimicrobiia bacterium]